MGVLSVLMALVDGPRTNAALQEATYADGSAVASDCAKLIRQGRIRRVDDARGRGSVANYAITKRGLKSLEAPDRWWL